MHRSGLISKSLFGRLDYFDEGTMVFFSDPKHPYVADVAGRLVFSERHCDSNDFKTVFNVEIVNNNESFITYHQG